MNPYESFNKIQSLVFKDSFKTLRLKESQFQLMCEMTVEFIKSETVGENSVLNELWEEEGNFFSGDGTRECIEQSIIK